MHVYIPEKYQTSVATQFRVVALAASEGVENERLAAHFCWKKR